MDSFNSKRTFETVVRSIRMILSLVGVDAFNEKYRPTKHTYYCIGFAVLIPSMLIYTMWRHWSEKLDMMQSVVVIGLAMQVNTNRKYI